MLNKIGIFLFAILLFFIATTVFASDAFAACTGSGSYSWQSAICNFPAKSCDLSYKTNSYSCGLVNGVCGYCQATDNTCNDYFDDLGKWHCSVVPTGPGGQGCGGNSYFVSCDGGGGVTPPPTPAPTVCVPKTCSDIGATCGSPSNGCGGQLSCGNCPSGYTCPGNGNYTCQAIGGGACTAGTGSTNASCGGQTASCSCNGANCMSQGYYCKGGSTGTCTATWTLGQSCSGGCPGTGTPECSGSTPPPQATTPPPAASCGRCKYDAQGNPTTCQNYTPAGNCVTNCNGCSGGGGYVPPACVPQRCLSSVTCGVFSDGCGGWINCGNSCSIPGQICNGSYCFTPVTVSGNVFVDTNRNGKNDTGESNYTGTININANGYGGDISTHPTPGAYVISNILGSYANIYYQNNSSTYAPPGYELTTRDPITYYCPSSGVGSYIHYSSDAVCDGPNHTVTNLNFGIAKIGNTISGYFFNDTNGNGLMDTGEKPYVGGMAIQSTGGFVSSTASGTFIIKGLNPGTYTVSSHYLPAGYHYTNPLNGGTYPGFTVKVGAGCSVDGSNSASCDASNNITSLNFGINGTSNTISGNIFVDTNGNGLKDATESNYNGSITITSSNGGTVNYPTSGAFSVDGLTAGTYTISYTSPLPSGYKLTYPLNGPPPSFTVTVGTGCSVGGSNSASCDASNNIANLNFGINNSSSPWIQIIGSDIRTDGGFTAGGGGAGGGGGGTSTFSNPIPLTAIAACKGAYTSVPGSTSTTPGMVFSGNGTPDFGQGSASVNNWAVGGISYPETFNPIRQGGVIKSSYAYMQSVAKQAGITPVDLASTDSNGQPYCSGGIANCTLSPTLPHGIYVANGNLVLTGSSYTFGSNQNYIILVNGNLYILNPIHVPVGSTVLFSVSGNIYVDPSVGAAINDYTSYVPDIEGIFSADKNFVVQGGAVCPDSPDRKLNIAGAIIVNAALGGGSFQNQRDLCDGNAFCPVFTVSARPDFILNAPNFVKKSNNIYQEVAP